MINLRWVLAPLTAAVVIFAMACGGDDGVSSPGNVTGATGPAPATGANGQPSGEGGTTSQELDLRQAAANLEAVQSFRFNLTMRMDFDDAALDGDDDDDFGAAFLALLGNIQAEGAYVAPDSFEIGMAFFGMDFRTIQIGDEAWVNEGSGWVEAPPDEGLGFLDGESPADLPFQFLPQETIPGARITTETVNGQETTRYTFDKDSLEELAEELGEDVGDINEIDAMDLDIWVNADGIPVKMLISMAGMSEGSRMGFEMEFNITDLNDPSISIDRPN